MSVGKDVIAEVEQVPADKVCCKNCGSSKEARYGYYCKAWYQRIDNAEKDFCSFFYVEED